MLIVHKRQLAVAHNEQQYVRGLLVGGPLQDKILPPYPSTAIFLVTIDIFIHSPPIVPPFFFTL